MQGDDLSADIQDNVPDYLVGYSSPVSRPRSGRQGVGEPQDSSAGGSGYLDSSDSSLSPDLVSKHLEPAPGSLSARCHAPRLALPPRSGEDSLRDLSLQRSANAQVDKPPPKSRLPRFTRHAGADRPGVTTSRAPEQVKPATGRAAEVPSLDRCLSMPLARCPKPSTDAKPPTRLGSSFGKGPSTSRARPQQPQARYSLSNPGCISSSSSSNTNVATPASSRAPPASTAAQPKRSAHSRKPSFKSQQRVSTIGSCRTSQSTFHQHVTEPSPRPPAPQRYVPPPSSTQASHSSHSQQQALFTEMTPEKPVNSVQRCDSAHSSTQEGVVLPLGDDELDKDLDEELRGMSFLSTVGQTVSSASSKRACRLVHEFSLTPSPMSSAPSYRPILDSSPPVRISDHTHNTAAQSTRQTSAVRTIDFAAQSAYASDGRQQPTANPGNSNTQHSPQSAMRSSTPGMTPAPYLGGISLFDCDDFGFSCLGLEDNTQSLSNDGFSTWASPLKSQTPAAARNVPPVPVLAIRQTSPTLAVLAAAEPKHADANVSLRKNTSGAAHVHGSDKPPEGSLTTSLFAASTSTPLAQPSQPAVTSSDIAETSTTMIDLRDDAEANRQDASSRSCVGAAATPSQRPSLHRALSSSLAGSADDDYASNTLHLTPALVEECSALVRALATVHYEAPIPEDSAIESSLTAAGSDVALTTPTLPDSAVAEYRPLRLFQGDSPNDTVNGVGSCADGAPGAVLPAIAEGSVPQGASIACPGASEHCCSVQQLHTTPCLDAPAACLATDQQDDSSSAAWLSSESGADHAAQSAEKGQAQAAPDCVHEEREAALKVQLQSPDCFQDAVESLATPSTGGHSDITTTASPWRHDVTSVTTHLSADVSPAQQVFPSASEGSLKQQKHAGRLEQVMGPSQVWDSVRDSVHGSTVFAAPCAQSLALDTDADRLSVMDESPTTRRAVDTTVENPSHAQPARVCSHVLDSFGTIDSAPTESPLCDTEALSADLHSARYKDQVHSMHRHEGSDLEPSIPLLIAQYGSFDQSNDLQTTLARDVAGDLQELGTVNRNAHYETEPVDLEGVLKADSARKCLSHVPPRTNGERVQ